MEQEAKSTESSQNVDLRTYESMPTYSSYFSFGVLSSSRFDLCTTSSLNFVRNGPTIIDKEQRNGQSEQDDEGTLHSTNTEKYKVPVYYIYNISTCLF